MAGKSCKTINKALAIRACVCALAICGICAVTLTLVLGGTTGCGQTSVKAAKPQAHERWAKVRAEILTGIASEHLKNGTLVKARTKAAEAVALSPQYAPAWIVMGKAAIEAGDFTAAVGHLHRARTLDDKNADAAYYLAVALERSERYDEALRSYRQAYFLSNKSLEPVKGATEVLAAMGQPAKALVYLEGFLPQAGNDPGMYELAGQLAMMTGKTEKACDYYHQAFTLDSDNKLYRRALGEARFRAGRYHDAITMLAPLAEDPKTTAMVHVTLGESYLAVRRLREATAAFTRATAIAPKVSRHWAALAKAHLVGGNTPEAIRAAQKACDLNGGNLDAKLLLAYALLRAGRAEEATRYLRQAIHTHPRDAMLWCVLGRAHAAGGNMPAATKCYDTALSIDPENKLARDLLAATAGGTRTQ